MFKSIQQTLLPSLRKNIVSIVCYIVYFLAEIQEMYQGGLHLSTVLHDSIQTLVIIGCLEGVMFALRHYMIGEKEYTLWLAFKRWFFICTTWLLIQFLAVYVFVTVLQHR